MLKKIYLKHSLEELANREGLEVVSYVNLDTLCIEVYENDEKKPENILRIPFIEDLKDQFDIFHSFLEKMDYVIPKGMSARRFLRETGQICKYYEFERAEISNILNEWFEDQGLELVLLP